MKKVTYLLSITLLGTLSVNAQFTTGNLAVLEAASASSSNTTASIRELNKTTALQTPVNTYTINGTTGTDVLRFSGSATSTGYLATSNDKTLLCFAGVNSTATGNVNAILSRGIGTINAAGTYSLAATYTGGSGNQARCATTLNNTNYYIADQGGLYTNSATAPSPAGNFRAAKPFGGIIYIATASSTAANIQVNTISAPAGGTLTGLPGLTNNSNLTDFYLIQSGSNGTSFDELYVVSATSNTAGSIAKYSLVSGSWVANGSYTTTFGGFGLTAEAVTGGANLYLSTGLGGLTGNSLLKLADQAGYNTAINITTANNVTLYTAPSGATIKGVAFAPVQTPLPVSFISFTAEKQSTQVLLSWATATEFNNDHFDVERSNDGKTYDKIATVKGRGTAHETTSYQFQDNTAFNTGTPVMYYRLHQVDRDGKSTYSVIRSVDMGEGMETLIYPVPFTNTLHIRLSSVKDEDVLRIKLLNMSGQQLYQSANSLRKGQNNIDIHTPDFLSPGIYSIECSYNGKITQHQVIKK